MPKRHEIPWPYAKETYDLTLNIKTNPSLVQAHDQDA